MPTTGFFGLVWRFNALAIAAAAIGALLIAAGMGVGTLVWLLVPHHSAPDTNLVPDQGKSSNFVLGGGAPVEGTPYVAFYLMSGYEAKFTSRLYDSGGIKNIMIVDGTTATGQWLFEGASQTIEVFDAHESAPLIEPNGLPQQRVQRALWLGVKDDGPDKPGADTHKTFSLVAFAFSDRKLHSIASGVDAVRGVHQVDDGKALIVYEAGGKTIAATVSTTDFSTLVSAPLPQLSTGPAP